MPKEKAVQELSPWWRRAVVITMLIGFTVLILVSVLAYRDAPPIPEKVVSSSGETLLTGQDIKAGQEVFLKYGLMENGTIWGHGAYLGPDFSAAYLHTLGVDAAEAQAQKLFGRDMDQIDPWGTGDRRGGSPAPPETKSVRPCKQDAGLHWTGGGFLPKADNQLDRLLFKTCPKRRLEEEVYQRSQGTEATDLIFCLGCLGFGCQSSRQVPNLHQ